MSSRPVHTEAEGSAEPALFRQQVVDCQRAQWLGTVLLEPRISHRFFVTFAVLSAVAVIALLVLGSYTRKERVAGWLVPEQGIARVLAPGGGVVTQIHVEEGAKVARGDPLVVLSTEVQSEAFGATREQIVSQLVLRRDNMEEQKAVEERLVTQQREDIESRARALATEREHLKQEVELQHARLRLADEALARALELRERALITLPRLTSAQQEQLDQAARLQSLEREAAALERQQAEISGMLSEQPFRHVIKAAEIDRSIAALEQEIAEAELRRQIIITAPQDGTVTAIQTERGGTANSEVPLMSIVPSGTVLQAQLFSPGRAVGFIEPGQRVLLRYQAFPFQKFGFYRGTVASLSRSAISPAELPQQLAGLSTFFGAAEPFYRITVDIESQTATAYGKPVQLQPGMQLEADIVIERRRLIEWVLDPLFTLTGTWHG